MIERFLLKSKLISEFAAKSLADGVNRLVNFLYFDGHVLDKDDQ